MEIKTKEVNSDFIILRLIGRFNIEEVLKFEEEFEKHLAMKKYIVLDLSAMKYIDSSGIGSLIKAMNFSKNMSIEFVLLDVNPSILNVFKLAYLDKFFVIVSSDDLQNRYPQYKFK